MAIPANKSSNICIDSFEVTVTEVAPELFVRRKKSFSYQIQCKTHRLSDPVVQTAVSRSESDFVALRDSLSERFSGILLAPILPSTGLTPALYKLGGTSTELDLRKTEANNFIDLVLTKHFYISKDPEFIAFMTSSGPFEGRRVCARFPLLLADDKLSGLRGFDLFTADNADEANSFEEFKKCKLFLLQLKDRLARLIGLLNKIISKEVSVEGTHMDFFNVLDELILAARCRRVVEESFGDQQTRVDQGLRELEMENNEIRKDNLGTLVVQASRCKRWVDAALDVLARGGSILTEVEKASQHLESAKRKSKDRFNHERLLSQAEVQLDNANTKGFERCSSLGKAYYHGVSAFFLSKFNTKHLQDLVDELQEKERAYDEWKERALGDLVHIRGPLLLSTDSLVHHWLETERDRFQEHGKAIDALISDLKDQTNYVTYMEKYEHKEENEWLHEDIDRSVLRPEVGIDHGKSIPEHTKEKGWLHENADRSAPRPEVKLDYGKNTPELGVRVEQDLSL